MKPTTALWAVMLAGPHFPAAAQQATAQLAAEPAATALPSIDIDSDPSPANFAAAPLTSHSLSREELRALQSGSSDVAALLTFLSGITASTGGGFSSMPVVHGLSEQRLTITVDGHPIDSACPNDMNTPLSYTDPQTVAGIRVISGVSPVSMGGDSIGAMISLSGPAPRFAKGAGTLLAGEVSAFFRSNGDGFGGGTTLTAASPRLSATYTGSYTQSGHYIGGGDLGIVHSTGFAKTDHAISLAWQGNLGLIEFKAGHHDSPYEGFVNQYMDMTGNRSWFFNGRYFNVFDWGVVDFRTGYRAIDHEMKFLADKGGTDDGGMPMNTRVRSWNYNLKVDVPLDARHTLRLGNEYHRQKLDDWWPPVPGSTMMGPDTYINVNDGRRERLGAFGEWQSLWSNRLATLIGARFDRVRMNAGEVQPYASGMMNMADTTAAMGFNATGRQRTDDNWSASALVSFVPVDGVTAELGYAHKARSPSLYERYSWGRGAMSSRMIGWFGDGNGYVGNLLLEPEQADTVSAALEVHGAGKEGWFLRIEPYHTRVHHYVDVELLHRFTDMMGMPTGFVQLQFVNTQAEFQGIDFSGAVPLWDGGRLGRTRLTGSFAHVHGQNLQSHEPLYHQMPATLKVSLRHTVGGFEGGFGVEWVADKTRVDPVRREPATSSYALMNLRFAYVRDEWRLSAEVQNLFDTAFDLPLGGISLGDYTASGRTALRPVPGRGRSFDFGLSMRF